MQHNYPGFSSAAVMGALDYDINYEFNQLHERIFH